MKSFCSIFILFILLVSCDKGELPKPVSTLSSSESTIQVGLGSNYENQVFFSLRERKIISQNNREIWDLAFESSENGTLIRLNSSKLMAAKRTNKTDITSFTSTNSAGYKHDIPNGKVDSTAFGTWQNHDSVYVIDRGLTTTGNAIGRMKLKIISVSETSFEIEFCPINSTTPISFSVTKSNENPWTYFSFDNQGSILEIAPKSTDWDILISAYTHVYHDYTPYSVTGVLLNPNLTSARIINKAFESVSYLDFATQTLSFDWDIIGFDWKTYNFDSGQYEVDNSKTFLIHTQENRVFKLRFVNFYDQNGVKGAPQFELVELEP